MIESLKEDDNEELRSVRRAIFFASHCVCSSSPTRAATGSFTTSSNLVAVTGYRHVCVREKWTRPLMGALLQWLCTGKHFTAISFASAYCRANGELVGFTTLEEARRKTCWFGRC